MALQPGEVLQHRYRIEGTLGQGGMGAVYRAWDTSLAVPVAVKENLFTTDDYARQFKREATILASLRHPNLPRVTDHFVIEGQGQYLVMDFIEGEDLRQRLERSGPIPEKEALPWFLEIADALTYMHTRTPPILHRDIKPGNIKVTPDGRAMLVDFGLAKIADESGSTTTGAKAMTPGFSPPEQYGTGRTDPRSDIYSLGATLYAALSAQIPEDALERAMGRAELTPLQRRMPEASSGTAQAIQKALAVRQEHRYQSGIEFGSALAAASGSSFPTRSPNHYAAAEKLTTPIAVKPTVSKPTRPAVGTARPQRRSPPSVLVGVGVVVIATIALASPGVRARLAAVLGSPEGTAATPTVESVVPPPATPTGFQVLGPDGTPTGIVSGQTPTGIFATATVSLTQGPLSTPTGGGSGQLAFASDREGAPQIYLVNLDGSSPTRLTDLQDGACQPAWSPDGSRLVFISPCRTNRELYPGSSLWIINADRTGLQALPTAPGGDFDPAWSPDGDRIAFTSLRDGRPQVYVINLDGTGLQNLNPSQAHDSQPAWSTSGDQLLFTTRRGGPAGIWIMTDLGESVQPFTHTGDRENTHAHWSLDGLTVLFEQDLGGIPRLVTAPYQESGLREVRVCTEGSRSAQPMAEPRWSPDGEWIVFETWPTGQNHDIGLVSISCAVYDLIISDPAWDFDPAWRP